jgi:gas vesicle protein
MDASGNSSETEYVVYVNEKEVDLDPVLDAIENLESAVKDTEEALGEKVDGAKDEITNGQEQTNQDIEKVEKIASDNTLVVVATVLAGVAALAAIGAVVLVIVKKN